MMRPCFFPVLLLLLSLTAGAQAPATHRHDFSGAERWAKQFDDPERDRWQKPDLVIRALALAPTAIVADVGAGTGYFAVRLARATPGARVFAVDVEPDMVRHIAERSRRERLTNIEAVLGRPDDPRLPAKADRVLLVNTYHHVDERVAYFDRLREDLNPGARVAIIDFTPDAPMGPARSARIARQQVVDEMRIGGYALAEEHTFLPYQYFLVFRAR